MNVNATLIVQAVNFFCAYWMFRILLFKPGYQVISQEQNEKHELEEVLTQKKEYLTSLHMQQSDQWQKSHNYFRSHYIEIPQSGMMFQGVAPRLHIQFPTQKEIQKITETTAIALVKAIEEHNGHS